MILQRLKDLHPLAWLVVPLAAVPHLVLNLRGAFMLGWSVSQPFFYDHGWPFTWCRREWPAYAVPDPGYLWPAGLDRVPAPVVRLDMFAAAADALPAPAVRLPRRLLFATGSRSGCAPRQYSLRQLLLLPVALAAVMALLHYVNPDLSPGTPYSFWNCVLMTPVVVSYLCVVCVAGLGLHRVCHWLRQCRLCGRLRRTLAEPVAHRGTGTASGTREIDGAAKPGG